MHSDVAITASEEFGAEEQPALGRKVFVQEGDEVDVDCGVAEKFRWKGSGHPYLRIVLAVHHRDFS